MDSPGFGADGDETDKESVDDGEERVTRWMSDSPIAGGDDQLTRVTSWRVRVDGLEVDGEDEGEDGTTDHVVLLSDGWCGCVGVGVGVGVGCIVDPPRRLP